MKEKLKKQYVATSTARKEELLKLLENEKKQKR